MPHGLLALPTRAALITFLADPSVAPLVAAGALVPGTVLTTVTVAGHDADEPLASAIALAERLGGRWLPHGSGTP